MEQKAKKSKKRKASFEDSLKGLEEIVRRMEGGDLALEESLELYEKGVQLTRMCSQRLDEAEKRIEIISRDEQGKVKVEKGNPDLFEYETDDAKGKG